MSIQYDFEFDYSCIIDGAETVKAFAVSIIRDDWGLFLLRQMTVWKKRGLFIDQY